MGFLHEAAKPHTCKPPRRSLGDQMSWITFADAWWGSVWRCDDCGQLFEVEPDYVFGLPDWRPAKWRTRRRYRTARGET